MAGRGRRRSSLATATLCCSPWLRCPPQSDTCLASKPHDHTDIIIEGDIEGDIEDDNEGGTDDAEDDEDDNEDAAAIVDPLSLLLLPPPRIWCCCCCCC